MMYLFGANGMLGRYVSSALIGIKGLVPLGSEEFDLCRPATVLKWLELEQIGPEDVIINCAGVIGPRMQVRGLYETIQVNSIFPHLLSDLAETTEVNVIHITTDGVFSGKKGKYSEVDVKDAIDDYGKTKALGEPENITVIRTSLIGEEREGNQRSLIEWLKTQEGSKVFGYTNHFWNGVTCWQLAKIIRDIIVKETYWKGVRHIFSPEIISKYQLLTLLIAEYNLDIKVDLFEATPGCDRSLVNSKDIQKPIIDEIPSIQDQIKEMISCNPFES
jgi:dTDP-4-dehydrorhamnose reductase